VVAEPVAIEPVSAKEFSHNREKYRENWRNVHQNNAASSSNAAFTGIFGDVPHRK
jgi:hypothetical protein